MGGDERAALEHLRRAWGGSWEVAREQLVTLLAAGGRVGAAATVAGWGMVTDTAAAGLYRYRARLVRVVDGDTLDLEVSLGFDLALTGRFRLLGLNAPELATPEGRAAKAWVEAALAGADDPGGWPLVVDTAKDRREKYGRYLGTVRLARSGWELNAELVRAGHAVPKTY